MTFSGILNDKTLTAAGVLLIVLVVWLRRRDPGTRLFGDEALGTTLLRVACGFVLVGASLDKVGDAAGFYGTIRECYFFLPTALQPLIAVVVPWVELFTGLCLLSRTHWRPAALVFCALMAAYTLAVAWDALQGVDCNCGCFDKTAKEKLGVWTVLRDLFFLGWGWGLLGPAFPGRWKKR